MLLLHSCCADCVLKFIASIRADEAMKNEEVTLYYYNPNIHPQSEFTARQMALKKVAEVHNTPLIVENWTPVDYFHSIQHLDGRQRLNKTLRCPNCWRLRLTKTFTYAKSHDFQYVSSTMVTSQYMNQGDITNIATELCHEYGVTFYQPQNIHCDIKTRGFYKQNYCGCVYSLLERMSEKYDSE